MPILIIQATNLCNPILFKEVESNENNQMIFYLKGKSLQIVVDLLSGMVDQFHS